MSNEKKSQKQNQPQPQQQTEDSLGQTELAKLLTNIKSRREFLSEQHQEYDYITKTGIHGLTIARESAKTDITALQNDYERRVAKCCARIFVVGGTRESVKDTLLSATEMDAVTVVADALYESIVRKVQPYLGEPPKLTIRANQSLVDSLAQAYLRYAPDSAYPKLPMEMLEGYLGTSGDDVTTALLNVVRTMVKNTAARPIAPIFAQEVCIKEALRLEVVEEPVAVVVTGMTAADVPDFEANFFPTRPFVVINLDEITGSPEVALKAAAKVLAKQMGLEVQTK